MTLDLATVGEAGLRLTPVSGSSLDTARRFDVDVVGTEVNVAANLARLGRRAGWVSAVASSVIGRHVEAAVRSHGVDTSRVVWSNNSRVSVYYSERTDVCAADGRERSVLYDRADSAFSRLRPEQIDWDYLLNTRWLHLTGITMAVSPSARAVVERAVEAARGAGVAVSFDVNYRSALWSAEEARQALLPLLADIDLLFCPSRDARTVFGLDGHNDDLADSLAAMTTSGNVVVSAGADGVIARFGFERFSQPARPAVVTDRAGAGDALAAGVLHGVLDGDFARGLARGPALAALAVARRGEQVSITSDELDQMVGQADGGDHPPPNPRRDQ